jgi:hypothetical protein
MLGKTVIKNGDYIGKFHGYARSRAELRSLYKKCGLKIIKEISVKGCKYVAVLGNDQVR